MGCLPFYLAAAAVVVGLTAAATAAAQIVGAIAAAGEQQDQDDDPPAVVATKEAVTVTHNHYLQDFFDGLRRTFHVMTKAEKGAGHPCVLQKRTDARGIADKPRKIRTICTKGGFTNCP